MILYIIHPSTTKTYITDSETAARAWQDTLQPEPFVIDTEGPNFPYEDLPDYVNTLESRRQQVTVETAEWTYNTDDIQHLEDVCPDAPLGSIEHTLNGHSFSVLSATSMSETNIVQVLVECCECGEQGKLQIDLFDFAEDVVWGDHGK